MPPSLARQQSPEAMKVTSVSSINRFAASPARSSILRKQQSTDSQLFVKNHEAVGETFWELHRKLGERYKADIQQCGGKVLKTSSSITSAQGQVLSHAGSRRTVDEANESFRYSERSGLMVSERLAASHASALAASRNTPLAASGTDIAKSKSNSLEDPPEVDLPQSRAAPHVKVRSSRLSKSSEFSEEHIFVPRMEWLQKSKSLTTRRKSRVSLTGDLSQSLPTGPILQEKNKPWYRRLEVNRIVLSPTGNFRSFWDAIGILILVKDTFGIPMQLVDVDVATIFPRWEIVTYFSVIYWCFDIFFSFFTGYLEKGTLITDCRTIACHYLQTWFLIDISISIIDLLLEFGSFDVGDSATATRFLRFLRLFRMLRLGKVSRVSAFLQDQFESEVVSIQFSLALVMVAMILVEHVIACVWFGLGGTDGRTWLTVFGYQENTFFEKYYACVRWALAQLGFGATAIEAVSETEGMYSNVVGFISLVTSSSVISSMTSLVGALHRSRSEETQQLGQLRRFLRQNQVDPGLSERIMRFLQYTYHERASSAGDNPDLRHLGVLGRSCPCYRCNFKTSCSSNGTGIA